MSIDPHSMLAEVHPDLVKVLLRAATSTVVPFQIIHGLRAVAEEEAACASGHSTTMHSRHLPNKDGVACAVDVVALPDGAVSWAPIEYQPIASAILDAGHALGIPIEWGGNWTTLKDFGHFQLPWAVYP